MSTIVSRIAVLWGVILAEVPVGTNLGLLWLLWALIAGRFLLSRGAVFPALAALGLPADAVRRSGAALAYGHWGIETLGKAWYRVVHQEDQWHAHGYEGCRPVACDLVGFVRPRLRGCLGKHSQSGADQALPAIVLAVVAAVGAVGTVRLPLRRLILKAAPDDRSEAALQRRAGPRRQERPCTPTTCSWSRRGSAWPPSGPQTSPALWRGCPATVRRVATSCPPTTAGGVVPRMGSGSAPSPAPTKARAWPPPLQMPPRRGGWPGGRSTPRSGSTSCSRRRR